MILTLSLANRKHANKKGTPQSLEVPLLHTSKIRLGIEINPRSAKLKIKNHTDKLRFNVQPLPDEILL